MMLIKHIGIMGAHGTGKTTLLNDLAVKQACYLQGGDGLKVARVSEVARRCPYPVNRDTSEPAQAWIFHAQIMAELQARTQGDVVLCDRTVFDSLAYAEAAGFKDLVKACMPEALRHAETYYYQIIFCRPTHGFLVDDGFRDTDPAFQVDIDKILGEWVYTYDLNVTARPRS